MMLIQSALNFRLIIRIAVRGALNEIRRSIALTRGRRGVLGDEPLDGFAQALFQGRAGLEAEFVRQLKEVFALSSRNRPIRRGPPRHRRTGRQPIPQHILSEISDPLQAARLY